MRWVCSSWLSYHLIIEFDYRTLTHRKTVEKLVIPDNSGLNDDVLSKYDNIKDVTSDFKDPIFKNIRDSDKWLILRTLNGTHYDIMGLTTGTYLKEKKDGQFQLLQHKKKHIYV